MAFFEIQRDFRFVSQPRIIESAGFFLRKLERATFNKSPVAITDLELCVGTRKLLSAGSCNVTTLIHDQILTNHKDSLDDILSKLRAYFLFLEYFSAGPSLFLYLQHWKRLGFGFDGSSQKIDCTHSGTRDREG
jgi:hypothetical protein